ncbi:MAG TPA: AAA family ATPase [Allosphingosinicella sp.]|nr:AAA family ATPase [Allosphingosinicella sp.]
MGEKLLAQRLIGLLRETNARTSATALALLDWARDQSDWLWPERKFAEAADVPAEGAEALSWERLPAFAAVIDTGGGAEPPMFASVDAAAEILELDAFELEVLRMAAALERLPRLSSLRTRLAHYGEDLTALLGQLAGAEPATAASRVRRSGPVALGLLVADSDPIGGGLELSLDWRFARVLDEGLTQPDMLIDALAGVRQPASLRPSDFAEHREPFRLLVRLLVGALARKAEGVNVLIYGPPGTGKTEFARTLAEAACASLFAVGEMDEDGEEPTRYQRLHALKRAQRLLARRGDSILLFDEMEDLFAEASIAAGGGRRSGSKIFVNRLLESNRVPTIWTSNAIDEVDPAHLRRMSYILRMGHPNVEARARIVTRAAEAEGVAEAGPGLVALLPQEEESASVARVALRAAALAGGGAADAEAVGRSLLLGMRGGRCFHLLKGGRSISTFARPIVRWRSWWSRS